MNDLHNTDRTEELQAIIGRMPTRFGMWTTLIVLFLAGAMGISGYLIRYPDVVAGQVVINSGNSAVKLIAASSGKLLLNGFRSRDSVKEGDYIAVIENAAKLEDVVALLRQIRKFNITNIKSGTSFYFPRNVSLGDLNGKYFAFINALEQFRIYCRENILTKQETVLKKIILQQEEVLNVSMDKLRMSNENVKLVEKFYRRDSILFSGQVITEAEFDKSRMTMISARDAYHNMLNNITSINEQLEETNNKLEQTAAQRKEKENKTRLDLIASYTDLTDEFKLWEQKYVFKSPVSGRLEYAKFWTNDQFIQSGEQVFTVVPLRSRIIGQMTLPASGAGKVKPGQEVVIKLDDYPYMEFGSIKGKVASISLTANTLKTDRGSLETYLVTIDLPAQLKTNYGSRLDFRSEIKGTGEVIVKDRKLGERLFDNLKYAVNK